MLLPKKVVEMVEEKASPLSQIHGLGGFIGGVGVFLLIFVLWIMSLSLASVVAQMLGNWTLLLTIPALIMYRLAFAHLSYSVAKHKKLSPGFWGVCTFFIGLLFILLCIVKPQTQGAEAI